MNGIRLINGSQASLALAAYETWLSEGVAMKMNPQKPVTEFYSDSWPGKEWGNPLLHKASHDNYLRGKKIYEKSCTDCHNQEEGNKLALGRSVLNTGAGMSKLNRAPMWIVQNMAQDDETLTRQEAMDVTIYMNAQPRPDFDLRKHLPGAGSEPYNSTVPEEKSKKSCRISTAFPSGPGVDVLYEYCRG